jgi:ribosome hibernation promoting factor
MHVYFVVRHLELTDAVRAYVEKHLVAPIRRNRNVMRVEIQIFREAERGNQFCCHVLVETKGRHQVNVREVQNDLYAAIDLAKDRVTVALQEMHDRWLTLRRHPKKYSWEKLARALGWTHRRRET